MAEEHVGRIFEPFYTTKEECENGLALALARRIVEDHGGTLVMRTSVRPERQGTAFKISLPRWATGWYYYPEKKPSNLA